MPNFNLSYERKQLFHTVEQAMISHPLFYELNLSRLAGEHLYVIDFSQQLGAHYRGVFVRLIRDLERNGITIDNKVQRVNPETAVLVENSTGNACDDFAIAAKLLGYSAEVFMPDGLPESRYSAAGFGANIIRTPKENYIIGAREGLVQRIKQNRERIKEGQKFYASPNHSGLKSGEITIQQMERSLDTLLKTNSVSADFVVLGMGNGASALGLGRRLKQRNRNMFIYAAEPFYCGLAYEMNRPGAYKKAFGIDPANEHLIRNSKIVFGLNYPISRDINRQGEILPLQRKAIDEVIFDIRLVIDNKSTSNHLEILGDSLGAATFSMNSSQLPNWEKMHSALLEKGYRFGYSSAAGIALAESLLGYDQPVGLAVVYDSVDKY